VTRADSPSHDPYACRRARFPERAIPGILTRMTDQSVDVRSVGASTVSTHTGLSFGYARVSTAQQHEALQRDALEAAGIDRLYVDQTSGVTQSRPALDEMLGQLRARRHRRHLATRQARPFPAPPHRPGRRARGPRGWTAQPHRVHRHQHTGREADLPCPRALVEFERALIVERTLEGLAVAGASICGRPNVWTEDKLRAARATHKSAEQTTKVASLVGAERDRSLTYVGAPGLPKGVNDLTLRSSGSTGAPNHAKTAAISSAVSLPHQKKIQSPSPRLIAIPP
jgi:hypothetical protein